MTLNAIQFAQWTTAFELGLTNVYRGELKHHPIEYLPWLPEKKTDLWLQTDWEVSGLGQVAEKPIGSATQTDTIYQGTTKQFELKAYGLGLVIQYEVMRWEKYKIFGRVAKKLAKSTTDRYNIVAYQVLTNSFSTSDSRFQTFQSETIVNTAHTRLDGGTWSNRLANNDGLSYEGVQKADILMRKQVDERGRYVQMRSSMLITSVDQDWQANTIINSSLRPGTANNDKNTLKGSLKIHTAVWLGTPEHWWIKCPKNEGEFSICMRLGDMPDLVSDSEPSTRNRHMSTYCSFDIAVMNSHGIVGSSGGA